MKLQYKKRNYNDYFKLDIVFLNFRRNLFYELSVLITFTLNYELKKGEDVLDYIGRFMICSFLTNRKFSFLILSGN